MNVAGFFQDIFFFALYIWAKCMSPSLFLVFFFFFDISLLPFPSTLMTFFLISKKVTVRRILLSTGCRFHSATGPGRWSSTVLNHVSQAQPWHGPGPRTPSRLPAVTVPLVFQTCAQRRYDSSKSTPSSVDLFSRHEAAKRRRQEEVEDKKGGDERARHVDKQKNTSRDRRSDRKRKDDEEAKEDPRKEAVEGKQGLKTFRPARLPIVLCHGKETLPRFFFRVVNGSR